MCGIVGIFDPQSSSENQKKKIKNCLSCENEIKEDLTPVLSNYCKICAFNKINYKKSR